MSEKELLDELTCDELCFISSKTSIKEDAEKKMDDKRCYPCEK